jgi:hypothetical protein
MEPSALGLSLERRGSSLALARLAHAGQRNFETGEVKSEFVP